MRTLVPSHEVMCFGGCGQVEEEAVGGVGGVVLVGDWRGPDGGGVETVEHGADFVRVKKRPKPWMAACVANFVNLLLAGKQSKPPVFPSTNNSRWGALRRNQRAEIDVAVQQD